MTEQEYLDSKNIVTEYVDGFTDRNGWENTFLTTLLKDFKEQLILSGVSQQRELLAFRKWQKDNWKDVYLYSDEFMISEFKKANCG